jgi:hypothetical protein
MWAGTTNRVRLSLGLRGFLSGPEGWYKLGKPSALNPKLQIWILHMRAGTSSDGATSRKP